MSNGVGLRAPEDERARHEQEVRAAFYASGLCLLEEIHAQGGWASTDSTFKEHLDGCRDLSQKLARSLEETGEESSASHCCLVLLELHMQKVCGWLKGRNGRRNVAYRERKVSSEGSEGGKSVNTVVADP